MQHVLLTGATGFLGSHLLEALVSQGYKVTILKRSTSDTWRIEGLLGSVSSYDVDQISIEDVFKVERIDTVIHTACSYGRNGEAASEIVESNLMFGLRLLDSAVKYGVGVFINTDTLLPKDLNSYSLSKKHFSEWAQHRSKEISVVNLKVEHMYGPKDDEKKFLPWLIKQLRDNLERVPLTEGNQLRDFVYIDDVVGAYLLILKNATLLPAYSEFDVATGMLMPVREFVEAVYRMYKAQQPGNNSQLGFGDIPMRSGETPSICVNNHELIKLGWKIDFTVEQGLKVIFKENK